jgi:intraflagellar transport protein 20
MVKHDLCIAEYHHNVTQLLGLTDRLDSAGESKRRAPLTNCGMQQTQAAPSMEDRKLITFDDEYRVRVLGADKHAASVSLQQNCAEFDEKAGQLKETAKKYISMLENVAENIEAEKLRAIGLRNRVGALQEQQQASAEEAQQRKLEAQKQLDALIREEESLRLVAEEQEAQISRLKTQSVA